VAGATAEACWTNRLRRRVSRAAFGVWSRSTAMLDAFWTAVRKGRACDGTAGMGARTVIGYGAGWGDKGGGGPHKRVRASADRIFGKARVITIKEWNTSKTCHVCGSTLQGIVDRSKNFKRGGHPYAVDRGLKRCASSCSSFLDRDGNVRWGGGGRGHTMRHARARAPFLPTCSRALSLPPARPLLRRPPSTCSRPSARSCAVRRVPGIFNLRAAATLLCPEITPRSFHCVRHAQYRARGGPAGGVPHKC